MLLAPLLVFYGYRAIGSAKPPARAGQPPAAVARPVSDSPVQEKDPVKVPDQARAARELGEQSLRAQERLSAVFSQELEAAELEPSAKARAASPGFGSPRPIAPEGMEVAPVQTPGYSGRGPAPVSLADCPGCKPVPVKAELLIRAHRQEGPRGSVMFVTLINESKRPFVDMAVSYSGRGLVKRWGGVSLAPGQSLVLKDGVRLEAGEYIDMGKLEIVHNGRAMGSVKGLTEIECEPGAGLGSVVPKL